MSLFVLTLLMFSSAGFGQDFYDLKILTTKEATSEPGVVNPTFVNPDKLYYSNPISSGNSVHIDDRGTIYIGTLFDGLYISRNGGQTFDEHIYEKDNIQSILTDRSGAIYLNIGRSGYGDEKDHRGLWRSEDQGRTFKQVLKNLDVMDLTIDSRGILYGIVPFGGLVIIDKEKKLDDKKISRVRYIQSPMANSFAVAKDGKVYLGTSNGLYVANSYDQTFQLTSVADTKQQQIRIENKEIVTYETNDSVDHIYIDGFGAIHLVTEENGYFVSKDEGKTFQSEEESDRKIRYVDSSGTIYASSTEGLQISWDQGKTFEIFYTGSVNDLTVTKNGTVYVASDMGLCRMVPKN